MIQREVDGMGNEDAEVRQNKSNKRSVGGMRKGGSNKISVHTL
jgi:hypothetical protein